MQLVVHFLAQGVRDVVLELQGDHETVALEEFSVLEKNKH